MDQVKTVEVRQDVCCLLQEMVKLGKSHCSTLNKSWDSGVLVHCFWSVGCGSGGGSGGGDSARLMKLKKSRNELHAVRIAEH